MTRVGVWRKQLQFQGFVLCARSPPPPLLYTLSTAPYRQIDRVCNNRDTLSTAPSMYDQRHSIKNKDTLSTIRTPYQQQRHLINNRDILSTIKTPHQQQRHPSNSTQCITIATPYQQQCVTMGTLCQQHPINKLIGCVTIETPYQQQLVTPWTLCQQHPINKLSTNKLIGCAVTPFINSTLSTS